uniref:Uncharacterized protein n=1 Tax=Spongospora subterranea TaxID=70186 RepID=A0A0H5QXG2_9EUKA|eukprot:CRZ06301.1 hypothetical protein [Spongospora subterranea]
MDYESATFPSRRNIDDLQVSMQHSKQHIAKFGRRKRACGSLYVIIIHQAIWPSFHKPGKGYWDVKASTLSCKSNTLSIKLKSGDVTTFMKSWSLVVETDFLASRVICTPS